MEKKQLRNVFTLALLLSTPLFASENGATITRIQAAKEVAQQNLQVAKAKMQAGLAVAKQFGIDKKDVFVAASKAQAATFMQSPKANSAAIAAGLYAGYDAINMVPTVNSTDSRTVKGAKVVGKAVAGSSAFATQFAAIQFLVSNWNVVLNPMQDKAKTAKVVAVALANIAYYTPQVRALVVKAASSVGINVFALGSAVAAKISTISTPTVERSAATDSNKRSLRSKLSFGLVQTTEDKAQQEEIARVAREKQFIIDAINVLDESSTSTLKTMFVASLGNVNKTNTYFSQKSSVSFKGSLLKDLFTESTLGISYAGTSARVLGLVNELLKFYTVKTLNLTKDNSCCTQFMNSEIVRIIAELKS